MKCFQLLAVAALVCCGGCYGDDSDQVFNPYDAGKKQPLVKAPDESEEQPAPAAPQENTPPAEPDHLVSDPDAQATPGEADLAGGPSAPEQRTIDPRLLADSSPERSRYPLRRPAEPERVRPAAGETPLADANRPNDPFAEPTAVEELTPPVSPVETDQLADDAWINRSYPNTNQPSPVETDQLADDAASRPEPRPSEGVGPAAEALASDSPDTPPLADIPPTLNPAEVERYNKPLLEETTEAPVAEPAADPDTVTPDAATPDAATPDAATPDAATPDRAAPASKPEDNPIRPSDRLLERANSEPNVPADIPSAEDSVLGESAPAPATEVPMPEATEERPAQPLEEASQVREWVDSTGRLKFKASFVKFDEDYVHLHPEGEEKVIRIPRERLSAKDQKFLQRIEQGDFGI